MDKKQSMLSHIDTHPTTVQRSYNGDTDASRTLLCVAIRALENNEIPQESVRNWLVTALKEVEKGEKQANAFKLIRPKGRSERFSEETQIFITEVIINSESGRHKSINKKGGSMGIYEELAQHFNASPQTIESVYKKHRAGVLESQRVDEELRREYEAELSDSKGQLS